WENVSEKWFRSQRRKHFDCIIANLPETAELLHQLINEDDGQLANAKELVKGENIDEPDLGLDALEMLAKVDRFLFNLFKPTKKIAVKNNAGSSNPLASYHRLITQYNIDNFIPHYLRLAVKPLSLKMVYR